MVNILDRQILLIDVDDQASADSHWESTRVEIGSRLLRCPRCEGWDDVGTKIAERLIVTQKVRTDRLAEASLKEKVDA